MNKAREALGHIIKEERIIPIKHYILPNTNAFSIDYHFPGFYGMENNLIDKPVDVIILTKKLYALAKILRSQAILNEKKLPFNISLAKLKIKKNIHYGIRIRGLTSYDQIPDLQKKLIHQGFDLTFKSKIDVNKKVSIKINKFFQFEPITDNICKDTTIKDIYYIRISKYINWEEFKIITKCIKNNVSNNNFDAAKGVCYVDAGVTEFIRIHKENISLELVKEISEKYRNAIKP